MAILLLCATLLGVARQVISTSVDPEHLCHKVMTGAFDRIQMRSITYFGPYRLWLFEGDRKYIVKRTSEISQEATFLPVTKYCQWNEEELKVVTSYENMNPSTRPLFLYLFGYANPERKFNGIRNPFHKEGLWFNLVTENAEYLWDIWCNWWSVTKPGTPCKPHETWAIGRVHPNYAILADQFKDQPEGYVINQAIYDNRSQLVIYDLEIDRPLVANSHMYTLELHIHEFTVNHHRRREAQYYYIEKTDNPEQVRLVHRHNYLKARPGTETTRQLLLPNQHPVGFKNGRNTFLFDHRLGCVYVITDIPQSLKVVYEKQQVDLLLKRKNIPYELFFKCNVEYFKADDFDERHDPQRCQTTVFKEDRIVTTPGKRAFLPVIVVIILGVVALLVTLLLVFYFWMPTYLKNRRKGQKQNKLLEKTKLKLPEDETHTKNTPTGTSPTRTSPTGTTSKGKKSTGRPSETKKRTTSPKARPTSKKAVLLKKHIIDTMSTML